MKKYIISKHSFYDSDRGLYKTEIGEDSISGPLLYSVWGNSVTKSMANACALVKILERAQEKQKKENHV